MSRIENALKNKKSFIGFVTAGDPSLEMTAEFVLTLEKAGASIVEIGIPFSDPVAEGEVIERANYRALSNGTTTDKIFDMVENLRKKTSIPLVFLTYANPVFTYGYERFFKKCSGCGIDGIIIPDMPYEEKKELAPYAKENGIDVITLIAPTSDDRISKLAKEARGFVYCVSSMGVTGVRSEFNNNLESMVEKIKEATDIPVAVGFGISTSEQAANICKTADGAIVGSAIVNIIEKYGENSSEYLYKYVREICEKISSVC